MTGTPRYALLSVTDKTGLEPLAAGLVKLGFRLLSTGGTAKALRAAGLTVLDVAEYTGQPEILDGRVKTLHPKVHGGILFDRGNPTHVETAFKAGIAPIDAVIVNLYRFREEAVAAGLTPEAAIEHIDIGGPAMLRAAAKNWQGVWVVTDPADYPRVLAAMERPQSAGVLRRELAAKTFQAVSRYDGMIAAYLAESAGAPADASSGPALPTLPGLEQVMPLRYGENPHQSAGLYRSAGAAGTGFGRLECLQGKELSYNNILDLDAAAGLVEEFEDPAAVVVKHTNPCGCAQSLGGQDDLAQLLRRAIACDPKSAFGGIIAVNRRVDAKAAEVLTSLFLECVAAPDFDPQALSVLASKPNLRLVKAPFTRKGAVPPDPMALRSVRGAFLVQAPDASLAPARAWSKVTHRSAEPGEVRDLAFAWAVVKHVKSNAIVLARDGAVVGVGAGQMSRIDALKLAAARAREHGHPVEGAVMASDAFFPFRDTVDAALELGVTAIVQPGGSKKDQDSIAAADAGRIAMVFTGERHFKH